MRAIQLWLFSQPQPLWVVTHRGYNVPYQLHCWPLTTELEFAELELSIALDKELAAELRRLLEAVTLDGAEELVTPEHTAPVTVGTSATPPFLFTWKPKATL